MRIHFLAIGCLALVADSGQRAVAQEYRGDVPQTEAKAGDAETPFEQAFDEAIARFKAGVADDAANLEALRSSARAMLTNQYRAFAIHGPGNKAGDDPLPAAMERLIAKRSESLEQFVDLRMELLAYRANGETVPQMVEQSLEELCQELDLHVRSDESLHEGALAAGAQFVTVQLPGMT
ncbi:MAG: hypothetical protein ACR2NP_17755 [Pirellulaceae bacterium]